MRGPSAALDRGLKLGGVFAASDELALGAMAAALDRGVSVPKDIAFVGFGGVAWSAHSRPGLTTVAGDPQKISEQVRDIFQHLDQDKPVPLRTVIPRTLLIRQSA